MVRSERSEQSFRTLVSPCMARRNDALLGTTSSSLEFDLPLHFIITLDGPRAFHRAILS